VIDAKLVGNGRARSAPNGQREMLVLFVSGNGWLVEWYDALCGVSRGSLR